MRKKIDESGCYKFSLVLNYSNYFMLAYNDMLKYSTQILNANNVNSKFKKLLTLKDPYVLESDYRGIDIVFHLLQAMKYQKIITVNCLTKGGGIKEFYNFVTATYAQKKGTKRFFVTINETIDNILKIENPTKRKVNLETKNLIKTLKSHKDIFLNYLDKYKLCLVESGCQAPEPQ